MEVLDTRMMAEFFIVTKLPLFMELWVLEVGQRTKELAKRQKTKVSFPNFDFLTIFLKIHDLFMNLGENSQEYLVIQFF